MYKFQVALSVECLMIQEAKRQMYHRSISISMSKGNRKVNQVFQHSTVAWTHQVNQDQEHQVAKEIIQTEEIFEENHLLISGVPIRKIKYQDNLQTL